MVASNYSTSDALEDEHLETDLEKELGFRLHEEKRKIVTERNRQTDNAKTIRSYMEQNYSDIYGGTLFDASTGYTTVLVTDEAPF